MRKLTIVTITLIFLLLASALPAAPTIAQQPDTLTYTTSEGLVVAYPANWALNEAAGLVFLSNTSAGLQSQVAEPGVLVAFIFGDEMVASTFAVPQDELELTAQSLLEVFNAGSETEYTMQRLEADGVPVYRIEGSEEGITTLTYIRLVDGRLVMLVAAAIADEMPQYEDDLLNITARLRYDESATPPSDNPAAQATIGWQTQLQTGDDPDLDLSNLTLVTAGPDGAIFVSDGLNILPVDPATGEFGPPIQPAGSPFITSLAAGEDVLWVIDNNRRLLTLDRAGEGLARTELHDGLPEADVPNTPDQGHVVGPDGNFYVFTELPGAEGRRGFISVYDTAGERLRRFETTTRDDDINANLYAQAVFLAFMPAGELLIYDAPLHYNQVISREDGTLIEENAFDVREDLQFDVPLSMSVSADGLLLASLGDEGRLVAWNADGERVMEYGRQQENDRLSSEFAPGEFLQPRLALLRDGHLVVVDSNGTYSQVVRLRLDALLE